MASKWAVITGGSSGIGAAVFRRLAEREPSLHILAVARRAARLEEVRRQAIDSSQSSTGDDRVRVVAADVGTPEGVSAVVSALPQDACVKYLVHDAATLGSIGPMCEIDRATWRRVVETNLDAPLFLTQALLPHLKRCYETAETGGGSGSGEKPRVLHVSSRAAHNAYVGAGPYCITKSGLNMMYRILSAELSPYGVLIGSVRPGVVDTPMQDEARGYDGPLEQFPVRSRFQALHETGKLEKPERIALYLHWLLSEVGEEEYCAEEWDIRCSKDDARWKEYERVECNPQ